MKKILAIGILSCLTVVLLSNRQKVPDPIYIPPIIEEKEIKNDPEIDQEISKLIDSINSDNSKIKSIIYENFKIDIKGSPFDARANLSYEKENNFRMISSSIAGKELDIGMNQEHFWFWSKRMKPSSLYYAKNEDVGKTRLRSPFNPIWLKSCIGVSEINKEAVQTGYREKFVYIRKIIQTNEGIVKRTTLIDPETERVIGNYLHRMNGNIIISTEILKFKEVGGSLIPSKIKTIWHEENFVMEWSIKKIKVNSHIHESNFTMPKNIDRINMADM